MKIRNILPKDPADVLGIVILWTVLLIGMAYEIIVVLPTFHEPDGFLYKFTFSLGVFLFLNIVGNIIACMFIDTSFDHRHVAVPPDGDTERCQWRFCSDCQRLAPPRSWHCKVCGVCMLKRDHHCVFTGSCIGHLNFRYYLCFLFYLSVGSIYALPYNLLYFWVNFASMNHDIMSGIDIRNVFHRIVLAFHVCLVFVVLRTLFCYVPIILRGELIAPKRREFEHNCGVYANLKSALGVRMHIAWIFPLIKSHLPDDGYTWKSHSTKESVKSE